MSEIPQAVLSEHFQGHMSGRRLVAAIFTTFRFEPSFFETEILPVFLDVPLSHASAIKLVQIEDALRDKAVSVYYDQHGLVGEGPARLDIRRLPIRHPTGIFHPKNVFALLEQAEADEHGQRERTLLCSCSSANLTRAGWWENVEVAHVEEIAQHSSTALRDSLIAYLDSLDRATGALTGAEGGSALLQIRHYLEGTRQARSRKSEGRLVTQFHDGRESVPDFIHRIVGAALQGLSLEVISPYLDGGPESAPLEVLLERFEPSEVRVFLPRGDQGEGLCCEELFDRLQARELVAWGALPGDLLSLGKGVDVRQRSVHAKVYRFFEPKRGGREIIYVGSANLTTAGHRVAGAGGNWETGFLVEVKSDRPNWWLRSEVRKPTAFRSRQEDDGTATGSGTNLVLSFNWTTRTAAGYWNADGESPVLRVKHAGVALFELAGLAARQWTALTEQHSRAIEQVLASTSLLHVEGEGPEPGLLLVQETGMMHRPSLLLELSPADILRYWSLLTVEQRAAFIESRAHSGAEDEPLLARLPPPPFESTLFDRFAGAFHSFQCLEQRVREALLEGKTREADYRLFGDKYDSLGTLLARSIKDFESGKGDRLEQYVNVLCVRQLLTELGRSFPDYWSQQSAEVHRLESALTDAAAVRAALASGDGEMPAFLQWFEEWFLQRAGALSEGQPC